VILLILDFLGCFKKDLQQKERSAKENVQHKQKQKRGHNNLLRERWKARYHGSWRSSIKVTCLKTKVTPCS